MNTLKSYNEFIVDTLISDVATLVSKHAESVDFGQRNVFFKHSVEKMRADVFVLHITEDVPFSKGSHANGHRTFARCTEINLSKTREEPLVEKYTMAIKINIKTDPFDTFNKDEEVSLKIAFAKTLHTAYTGRWHLKHNNGYTDKEMEINFDDLITNEDKTIKELFIKNCKSAIEKLILDLRKIKTESVNCDLNDSGILESITSSNILIKKA